ncbi:exodeoxyribonuclease VII, large subunit [Lentilactobacillus senioris DSM 24302 = JCM 17472]|uniref:Exodeoxyribonuclease 7 large subunit n=1 Tax=Lentilactobacillus senioris DSM 24302 = JCM 17472 TaxID=1423802 RepID=A0A0R2CQ44_9LACO|nr:exodeoxyribonuclease VII large subunit [Lentilactobacillus senioris]KRM93901.1 exodeoxyribonuclease VII, large subunit [Lentilactobacillus senioris DSM 24302 = JCM 17472]
MASEYLSVTALTQYLKRKFDYDPYLGKVYLTGEISNFRLRLNAHQYFSLKDDHAKINAIMFKSAFNKVKFRPEEGMKVLVMGHISLYEPSGSYQIYVERMEPDGVGQLYQALEQLKRKLDQEGLFNAPKKELPVFPKKIAVVTSPSGAVIRDIITTVKRRFPIAQIVLFPALVQGNQAAVDIANRINQVNELGGFDTLIIGRGGGSIEDLWPFNEEVVARAIFDSSIPVISSVGHETDTTIADLVADRRAATPTAAAELAVPRLDQVKATLSTDEVRLVNGISGILKQQQLKLTRLLESPVMRNPQRIYENYSQQIDLLFQRLTSATKQSIQNQQQRLASNTTDLKLTTPINQIKAAQQHLNILALQLQQNIRNDLNQQQQQLQLLAESLDHLSPLKIMSRGFTVATNNQGKIINSTKQITKDEELTIKFHDGQVIAKTIEVQQSDGGNDGR